MKSANHGQSLHIAYTEGDGKQLTSGINNKSAAIIEHVVSNDLDILAITQSWLTGDKRDDPVVANVMHPLQGYSFISKSRTNRVCLIFKDTIQVQDRTPTPYRTFEHLDLSVTSTDSHVRLIILYRPPPSSANQFTVPEFMTEFSSMLEHLIHTNSKLLIAGDFNFHVNDRENRDATDFLNILECANLAQCVIGGHTLDLCISRSTDSIVTNICYDRSVPSDHTAIVGDITAGRPTSSTTVGTQSRKLRSIRVESLIDDIGDLFETQPSDTADMADHYHSTMKSLPH